MIKKRAILVSQDKHTMGDALFRYLEIKVHHEIVSFCGTIVVQGLFDRALGTASIYEKNDKYFNWKRPTVFISDNERILYVNCFPGCDYVYHYASIIRTFYYLKTGKDKNITVKAPKKNAGYLELKKTNIMNMPCHDIVIIGIVSHLTIAREIEWQGEGDFQWKSFEKNGKNIALLGCQFSFWGDISGHLIKIIAELGAKIVIYTGKLGAITPSLIPNQTLATGNESTLNDRKITWKSALFIPWYVRNQVHTGSHITLFSVLAETKEWLDKVQGNYDFVDPEIGYMAKAAKEEGIEFGYIHLVTDNLSVLNSENLSNERENAIVSKRRLLYEKISSIINFNLQLRCPALDNIIREKIPKNKREKISPLPVFKSAANTVIKSITNNVISNTYSNTNTMQKLGIMGTSTCTSLDAQLKDFTYKTISLK